MDRGPPQRRYQCAQREVVRVLVPRGWRSAQHGAAADRVHAHRARHRPHGDHLFARLGRQPAQDPAPARDACHGGHRRAAAPPQL